MTLFFKPRIFSLIGIILVTLIRISPAQEPKIGDISDGSRSFPVHLLNLFDEEGALISPSDILPMPFSPKQTCIECHDYTRISKGWHFDAADPHVSRGRRGEPWVLSDPVSATQIPLSQRNWPGTMAPGSLGLTPFLFTEKFGRHLTGGGISENDSTESLDIYLRWLVSGKAEINCLACHDAESAHDQAEYDLQTARQNYRWAAAATSGFASVSGSAKQMPDNYDIYSGAIPDIRDAVPPRIKYNKNRFDQNGKVLFDIIREAPDQRCNFCHSAKTIGEKPIERWITDKDVHTAAGMACVDCHRNGIDHSMVRGYESEADITENPSAAAFSCAGCHLRELDLPIPSNGRLGAPYPRHKNIPVVHFDKLSCTSCHSGPWPEENAQRVKLSRAHALGTYSVKRSEDAVPYMYSPVYARGEDGKIAPHRLLWPAYWAFMEEDNIDPILPESVQLISLAFILADSVTAESNIAKLTAGEWPVFSEIQIIDILDSLKTVNPDAGTPVYICGGKLFSISNTGSIDEREHAAAVPYTWAFAHDVRPAEQSLGIRGCDDCHSVTAAFSFGNVQPALPADFAEGVRLSMTSFQDRGAIYPRIFAVTFLFRPFTKYLIMACGIVMFLVLLVFSLKGIDALLKKWPGTNS
ncbi:hypothetical protein ACFL67_02405 [candidate division KSB1 bacterium]